MDLVAASYSANETGISEDPDGCVCVWSLQNMLQRPESVLQCQARLSPNRTEIPVADVFFSSLLFFPHFLPSISLTSLLEALTLAKSSSGTEGNRFPPTFSVQFVRTVDLCFL